MGGLVVKRTTIAGAVVERDGQNPESTATRRRVLIPHAPGQLLRPQRTLEEEFQSTLEEEALLQSIEDNAVCPGCGRRIREDWVACPSCHTRLKKPCHQCGRLMELPWNLCPYCGTPAPGMRRENMTIDDAMRNLPVESVEPTEEPE